MTVAQDVLAIRITRGHLFRKGGPAVKKDDVLVVGGPENLTATEALSKVALGYAVVEQIEEETEPAEEEPEAHEMPGPPQPQPLHTRDPYTEHRDPDFHEPKRRGRPRAGGGRK
jgi:hypothetical protein